MKKSEFKKRLRKEKHYITKDIIFEILFVVLFISLCAAMIYLQSKDILPSTTGLIFDCILLIIGTPYFVFDFKRDKTIKEMYEHYQKENKIPEVKDNSKILKIMLIIEIICVLIFGGFIITRYAFNEEPKIIEIEPNVTMLKDGTIIQIGKYKFDNDNFSLIVPLDFVVLDEDMINKKYPNGNPPQFVLSNDRTTINIVVNATNNPLKNSQIKNYIMGAESQISKYSDVIDTRFFERNGHEVGEIKFISKAADTDIYNHMIVFSDNGLERIISFNCTKELQENWQEVGELIINSLAFK